MPVTVAAIILILIALGIWFLYLHEKQSVTDAVSAGRGLGTDVSSAFPGGSAYQNVVSAVSSVFGGGTSATSTPAGATKAAPQLWEVATAPAASITFAKDGTSTVARFLDAASGNIFDADPATSVIARRTKTLMPRIAQGAWYGEEGAVLRYEDNAGIETFSGSINAATTTGSLSATEAQALAANGPGDLEGAMLPRGILDLVAASSSIFYIAPYNGEYAGTIAKPDGSDAKRIWTSPLAEWRAQLAGNRILLVQAASEGVTGSAYELGTDGSSSLVLANLPGLAARENATTHAILYSTVGGSGAITLSVRASDGKVQTLPFATFADKCAWDPAAPSVVYCAVPHAIPQGSVLPDAWYRGEVHFDDAIWRFDTATGSVSQAYDPHAANRSLDILDPMVSPDGTYLAFRDAASGTGWVLRLTAK